MEEFGDKLGTDIIFHNIYIFSSSLDKILIFDTNLKLQHTIKVQQIIRNLHVDDLQICALTDEILYIFSQDRTLLKKIKLQAQSPIWKGDIIYFYSNKKQAFCQFQNKVEILEEYKQKDSIKIQLLLNKYIVAIDDNQLIILDEGVKILKQMPRKFTQLFVQDNYIATSDESGRLIVFKYEQKKATIILQEHWHAHPINCIIIQNESIFTSGKEGVVVQWHLGTGRKAFFPRQGSEIISMALKDEIFVGLSNNRIQKVPLNGSPTHQYWQGIQNNSKYQNYQSIDGRIITNGISGQLQVLNGQFIKNIDVLQQNYVSEVGAQIKDQLDISKFLFVDQYLFCAVSSQNLFQLIFLELVDNNYIQTTSVNYQEQIYGFDTIKSDQLILLTYGKYNIRMWKKITSERGNKIWTCIFNQQQINEVRYAKLQNDKGSIRLQIAFDQSLIVFHPQTNSIRIQIVFKKQLQTDSQIIIQNNLIIYSTPGKNGVISLIDLKTQYQKIISLKFQTFTQIFEISDKYVALIAQIEKVNDQHVILVDTHKQQVNKIIQLNGSYENVFFHLQNNVNYLVGLNQNQYQIVYQFESEKKSSYIQEMEIETQQEEKQQDIQPIIETTKINSDNNALKRYVLSEQQRQLKNINFQDYFINQSHLLHSLKFVTKRIQEVLKCDIDPQVQDVKIQDKIIELDQTQNVTNKKLQLTDLKRLFLTN
ncbi:WD repeat-containing protein 75 [Paramecium bursaria]